MSDNKLKLSKIFFYILALAVFPILILFLVKPSGTKASVYGYNYTKTVEVGSDSAAEATTTNSLGDVYVTGYYMGTNIDFDPGIGTDIHSSNGNDDIFLTKYNADGSYAWTKTMGGIGNDVAKSIAVDANGNIYISGSFVGIDIDFDPGPGESLYSSLDEFTLSSYLTKFDSSGAYVYTYAINSASSGNGVTPDSLGNVYLAGTFLGENIDLDPTIGEDLHTSFSLDVSDMFLTKISSDGSYLWTETYGSILNDYSVTVDVNGFVYVAGTIYSASTDAFVSKYASDGSLIWTRTWGGINDDFAYSVKTDSSGNLFIVGTFSSPDMDFDATAGTDLHSSNSDTEDIFITKYLADGSYAWTKTIGSGDRDSANAISIDNTGNIYVAGYFHGTVDFDPGIGVSEKTSTAVWNFEAFVASYDNDGNFKWVHTAESSESSSRSYVRGLAFDNLTKSIYSAGIFKGVTNFDPSKSNETFTSSYRAPFFTKLSIDTTAPVISLTSSDSLSIAPADAIPNVTGSATDSAANTTNVEYQMDLTSGTWNACSADDSSFDSPLEVFTCSITESFSSGSHTIYLRSSDSNGNVTTSGFKTIAVTIVVPSSSSSSTSSIASTSSSSQSSTSSTTSIKAKVVVIPTSSQMSSISDSSLSSSDSSISSSTSSLAVVPEVIQKSNIAVTMLDLNGSPYSNVLVRVLLDGKLIKEVYTNSKGVLELNGLILGEYVFEIEKDGNIVTSNISLTKADISNSGGTIVKTISLGDSTNSILTIVLIISLVLIGILFIALIFVLKQKKIEPSYITS
ncbi:MAG: SBBP repeat-containing protein [bacterium]